MFFLRISHFLLLILELILDEVVILVAWYQDVKIEFMLCIPKIKSSIFNYCKSPIPLALISGTEPFIIQ